MGIFRLLKQWREESDGTLSGPKLAIDSSQTVTAGPIGDDNEWVPLMSFYFGSGEYTTTSTTYAEVTGNISSQVLYPRELVTDVTNLDAVGVALFAQLTNASTSDPVYARLGGKSTSEISGTNFAKTVSQVVETTNDFPEALELEMKVDGGDGRMRRPGVVVFGRVA